ncbi:MAG: aspartate kinase [Phycisphaerae bacterium]|nr:aspartate kinase [Phycisphaerae bacterium]
MPILVQKFGGTSVADAYRIHLAARRAVRALLDGNQVVMVVSAMGHTTDHLVGLARQVTRRPSKREMDMLLATGEQVSIALVAMAIHEAGYDAISLTGAQIGLLTDSRHTEAHIQTINTERIRRQLDQGRIVIVAGFQGVDPDFNITTLGRGGSDTTAVALAAALGAAACEIYTDVPGVYSADPRTVPRARKLDQIGYDEMLELAALGAGVMHPRSIELGMNFSVPIHVRSSFSEEPGTMIMSETRGLEEIVVRGCTLKPDIGRVTLIGLPNEPGIENTLFEPLARRHIIVDDIIQLVAPGGQTVSLSFTVSGSELGEAQALAETIPGRYAGAHFEIQKDLAKLSAVGAGMRSHSGVAATMFAALAAERINIENISTSEIVISVLVRAADAERALLTVHRAFGLEA